MESAVVRLPLPRRQSPALLPTALWVDPGPLVVSKSLIVWCCCPDSNGGPTDYESGRLCRFFRGETERSVPNSLSHSPPETRIKQWFPELFGTDVWDRFRCALAREGGRLRFERMRWVLLLKFCA